MHLGCQDRSIPDTSITSPEPCLSCLVHVKAPVSDEFSASLRAISGSHSTSIPALVAWQQVRSTRPPCARGTVPASPLWSARVARTEILAQLLAWLLACVAVRQRAIVVRSHPGVLSSSPNQPANIYSPARKAVKVDLFTPLLLLLLLSFFLSFLSYQSLARSTQSIAQLQRSIV